MRVQHNKRPRPLTNLERAVEVASGLMAKLEAQASTDERFTRAIARRDLTAISRMGRPPSAAWRTN